jgi:hypothetical protein
MHRSIYVFYCLLASGCWSEPSVENGLEGFSNNGLSISALAELRICDDVPCTSITVTLRQSGGYATAASLLVGADGNPQVAAAFIPEAGLPNGSKYRVDIPRWIESIRIEATAGDAHSALWSNRTNLTPREMNVEFPDQVTVGATPSLTWSAQGRPVETHIVFATSSPVVRFGALESFGTDDGIYNFSPTVFSNPGRYTIGLTRHLEDFTESLDPQLQLSWISSWQKGLTVSPALPSD